MDREQEAGAAVRDRAVVLQAEFAIDLPAGQRHFEADAEHRSAGSEGAAVGAEHRPGSQQGAVGRRVVQQGATHDIGFVFLQEPGNSGAVGPPDPLCIGEE
ncbi:MAG: hypothetical protein E5X61_22660, partial [Mesorhizobium sp.]